LSKNINKLGRLIASVITPIIIWNRQKLATCRSYFMCANNFHI